MNKTEQLRIFISGFLHILNAYITTSKNSETLKERVDINLVKY